MLSGDNGLLTKAGEAKETTEMAEIKEQAELIKSNLLIGKLGTSLNQTELANSIATDSYFKGSSIDDNIITTEDEKYDVIVEDDLNIKVIKHILRDYGDILLSFNEVTTGSRAVILQAKVADFPTVEEYNQSKRAELEAMSIDELKEEFASKASNGQKSWNEMYSGAPFSDVKGFYEYGPKNSGQFTDEYDYMIKSYYNYNNIYTDVTTITYKGESKQVIGGALAEFIITNNGEYKIKATNDKGEKGTSIARVTKCLNNGNEEKFSDIQTDNYTISIDGYEVTIPAGFAYGISESVGKVDTGLVITDSIDKNNYSTGNEFVWIPVDKTNLTVGKTNKAMAKATSGVDSNENTNYEGVLYDFSGTSSTEKSDYGQNTNNGYREPATPSNRNIKPSSVENISIDEFYTEMQERYNEMISSIKTYGGFYVARYEMGKDSNYSKLGVDATNANENETKNWWGLYNKAKTYTSNYNSVKSNMIWGSQYDAMLNFALANTKDNGKVATAGNGNHYPGKAEKTGMYIGTDYINNVYDLEGNLFEWTQEYFGDADVILRGDSYNLNHYGGANYSASNRYLAHDSVVSKNTLGSRISLFII